MLTRAPQRVRPRPHTQLKAVGAAVGALGALTGEVTGLVGFNGAVGSVVLVGGQRVPLLRLHVVTTFKYEQQRRERVSGLYRQKVREIQSITCSVL